MPPPRFLFLGPAFLVALGACGPSPPHLGTKPEEAQHHLGEALGALGSCFGPSDREPALEAVRPKLLNASLVPSRVFDDESAWVHREGETRGLGFRGFRAGGQYRIGVDASPPLPTGPADYQGWLSLRRLGPGEFEWSSTEQIGLGPLPLEVLSDGISEVVRAAEASETGDARPVLKQLLPRTAQALGRGIALEALRIERDETASTPVFVAARYDLESLTRAFPRYASFLRRYVVPIQLRLEIIDGSGGIFGMLEAQEGRYALRARIRDGHLVPLEGRPRPSSERLRLRLDLTSQAGLFRYGVQGLEGDVRLVGRASESRFEAVFGREPGWVIPFLVKPFLRSSLRRPFEGEGAFVAYALRENGSGMTVVSRDYRIAVKESWLVRWLGGNAGEAVASFREGAEGEADRFNGEALMALRADLIQLLGGR
jgi:hypothetical protein